MKKSNAVVIAIEVLEQHVQIERNKRCVCGWRPDWTDRSAQELFPEYRQHRSHVAEMLDEAGVLK